jgi:hypothetical protein
MRQGKERTPSGENSVTRYIIVRDVNILAVQKLMRHATLSVTLRYAHLAPSHLHAAVEKLCAAASVTASVTGVSDATQKPRQILQ